MSEVKPVAGQWYAEGESRFYCVGISTDGCFVFQSSNGYSFAYHKDDAKKLTPVSYTHLTLPTICSV